MIQQLRETTLDRWRIQVVLFAALTVCLSTSAEFNSYAPGNDSATEKLEGLLRFKASDLTITEHARQNWIPEVHGDLPELQLEVINHDDYLIPKNRNYQSTDHPFWDYMISPGKSWSTDGVNYASLPFTLVHRWFNCTHNGLLNFEFDSESIENARVLVNQETCHFLQVDMEGSVDAALYEAYQVPQRMQTIDTFRAEVRARLPHSDIAELVPSPNEEYIELIRALPRDDDLSLLGVYYDGHHYTTECRTRGEPYPFCEHMLMTSFSTAKTVYPAVVLMVLAQELGLDVYDEKIEIYLSETEFSPGNWNDVTFDHVGDMTSGNFEVDSPLADPSPGNFYGMLDQATKLREALSWKHGAPAGSKFIYQTADTFILATALDRFIGKAKLVNQYKDSFEYLTANVMQPLNLSPELMNTRRTPENGKPNSGTAFGGMGMWFNRDGIVRLAKFLAVDDGVIDGKQVLHPTALADAMQHSPERRGLATAFFGHRYNNGTWSLPIHEIDPERYPCEVTVAIMSGLSGVRVIMMPNDVIIYYFNDAQRFPTLEAAAFANELKPFCEAPLSD